MSISIHGVLVETETDAVRVVLGDFIYGAGLNSQEMVAQMNPQEVLSEYLETCGYGLEIGYKNGRETVIHTTDYPTLEGVIEEIIEDAKS